MKKVLNNIYFQLSLITICSRLLLIGAHIIYNSIPLQWYVQLHDGQEYLIYARYLSTMQIANLPEAITRLGVGYPLLIVVFKTLLGMNIASLFVNVLGTVITVLLFYRIFQERTLAFYFIFFTPSWFHYSTHAMSEGIFVGVSMLALYFWIKQKSLPAGLVLGFAFLIRPVALWLILPILIINLIQRKWQSALLFALGTLLIPGCWIFVSLSVWHSLIKNIATHFHRVQNYYSPPFWVFLTSTFSPHYSFFKKLYFWLNYFISIYALIALYRGRASLINLLFFWWLILSLVFYTGVSSPWAFECFDRYILSCLPALIVGLKRLFPRNRWGVLMIAFLSFAISLYWDHNLIAIWTRQNHFINLADFN
ncbi:hypothetical protein J7M23_00320 [Candidatus Sumerlaeota bacterium]|nr:hypothetical protein [Candidatus Sumerlaeota bacterium]